MKTEQTFSEKSFEVHPVYRIIIYKNQKNQTI